MQLVDRIEKRRFVGREFLLWLWFESELFEGTLSTRDEGSFGLWIEKQVTLTAAKEATRIRGAQPTFGREAKESLLRGKLPESASFHLLVHDRDAQFTLKADRMALAGLSLPAVLGGEEEAPPPIDAPPQRRKKKARDEGEADDAARESFYERMHLTREVESLLESLYQDFLVLRLGPAWAGVSRAIAAWARGTPPDAEKYREMKDRALGERKRPARAGKASGVR